MNRTRTIVGLCMLCAFAISALAAQGASGATNGTTAFTCKKTGAGGGFSDAHCKSAGSGDFSHVAVAEGTTTEISGVNTTTGEEKTVVRLHNVQSGVEYEAIANSLSGTGWVTNAKDPSTGEHYVHGEMKVQLSGLSVTKPAGKGCKIKEGSISSNSLKATTKGQGDFLKFEPASGTVMTEYTVEGCSIAALNATYDVTGSFKCPVVGSTINCTGTETTAQKTLKERGQNSGVEGTMTLTAKNPNEGGGTFTPLSATTIATP